MNDKFYLGRSKKSGEDLAGIIIGIPLTLFMGWAVCKFILMMFTGE